MPQLNLTLQTSPGNSGSQFDASTTDTRIGTASLNLTYWTHTGTCNFFGGRFVFPKATLPAGATITAAHLHLKNRASGRVAITATIQARTGYTTTTVAPYLTTSTALTQVSGHSRLPTSVTWTATLTATAVNASPTIKTVIQGAVSQSGWPGPGPTVAILLVLHFTSTTHEVSFANLGNLTTGPKLVITYTTGSTHTNYFFFSG